MKTLYKFILKSYIGPFIMTFFIAMFVFFMMFIFKYIDDFVGKGLDASILAELFFYFSLTTIPMALPLAILLSSLMTFGNLGEHFELTAMKSAGLSLQKIMTPLIVTTFCIALGAFYFSNSILPYTNLKAGSLLYDVRQSKPALLFKDGIFNNSIEGFSMRIGKKEKDSNVLHDILIYDHRAMKGNNTVLCAKTGTMQETPDKMFLVITLKNGYSYKDINDDPKDLHTRPFARDQFEERTINFDLSEFKMSRTNEDLFKNNYQMLNLSQLNEAVDSLKRKGDKRMDNFYTQIKQSYYSRTLVHMGLKDSALKTVDDSLMFENRSKAQQIAIIENALNTARSAKAYSESIFNECDADEFSTLKYKIEWHRKFTLSIACIVLFFIGAPLGSIIRKGGLGMPVVISVVFFIVFHILSITGEKLAKEGEIPVYQGMWLATAILFPIGVFLTFKATSDSSLFDVTAYTEPIKKLFTKRNT